MWFSEMSDINKIVNDWEKSYRNMIRAVSVSNKFLILISLIIPSFILPLFSNDELVLAFSLITGLIGVVSVFVFIVNFTLIIEDHLEAVRNYFEKLTELFSVALGREATVKIGELVSNPPFKKGIQVKYTPTILLVGFTALLFASDPSKHLFMVITLLVFNALPPLFIQYSLLIFNKHVEWEVNLINMLKNMVSEGLDGLVEHSALKMSFYSMITVSIVTFTLYPVVEILLKFNPHYSEHVSIHRKNHLVIKSYLAKTLRLS